MLEKSLYDRFYRLIFFLKQFKLQQFNIISFFLFFFQSNPNVYLDYLEYSYKSNKFSKIRLILSNFPKSGHL